jgi:hypothetical protein
MTARHSQLGSDPPFADRYALTSRDQSLEAMILAGLKSSQEWFLTQRLSGSEEVTLRTDTGSQAGRQTRQQFSTRGKN